jgi:hypothetical protein
MVFFGVALAAASAAVVLTGTPAFAAYTYVGTFRISTGFNCLEVYGSQTANGIPVILGPCDSGDNQRWAVFLVTGGNPTYYQIMAYGGAYPLNKCLDAPDSSQFVHIWGCHGGHQQRWETYSGQIRLVSGDNRCLGVLAGQLLDAIHQNCNSSQFPPPNWTLTPV